MKICDVIKQIRLELELSQIAFAEKLGVSFSTVNRWENKKAIPNRLAIKVIIALAKEFGIQDKLIENLK